MSQPATVLLQWRAPRAPSRAQLDHVATALTDQGHDLASAWPRARRVVVTADPAVAAARSTVVWPMTVMAKSSYGLGVHLDTHGHPYAEISATDDWTITASHELVEMLVDPLGRKLVTAPSVDPADKGATVRYLVEVADPVEALGYDIDGVSVSDFVTPSWYRPAGAAPYSFTRGASQPLRVLDGGYVSWIGLDGHWHQLLPDGTFVRSQAAARLDDGDLRAQKDAAFAALVDR